MTTKKFWCHYIGTDGNTPKRRNIELTDIHELLPCVSNKVAKTPLWYEREDQDYGRVYYHLYAQISDNVAVLIHCAGISGNIAERLQETDEDIVARWNKHLDKMFEEYPKMSDERKSEENKSHQRNIEHDKVWRNDCLNLIADLQDYDNYLLAGGTWITASTIKAYEEVKSPILSGLKEIRAIALERREEEDRQERERIRKEREEEERKKAEEEARERERLTQEAEKFKNGESISGSDVVDLCRRHNIAIHLRTVHNLQQVIAVINGKNGTCQYYRTKGRRRPQLDGCYKTAEELYNYLQDH